MREQNIYVATVNGKRVGFSDVDGQGYIDMMFVSPRYLRLRVTGQLLDRVEAHVRAERLTELRANVSITTRLLRRPEPTTAFIHRRVGDIATDRGLSAPSYSGVHAISGVVDSGPQRDGRPEIRHRGRPKEPVPGSLCRPRKDSPPSHPRTG